MTALEVFIARSIRLACDADTRSDAFGASKVFAEFFDVRDAAKKYSTLIDKLEEVEEVEMKKAARVGAQTTA